MRPYEVSQIDLEIENTALNRDKYNKKCYRKKIEHRNKIINLFY